MGGGVAVYILGSGLFVKSRPFVGEIFSNGRDLKSFLDLPPSVGVAVVRFDRSS